MSSHGRRRTRRGGASTPATIGAHYLWYVATSATFLLLLLLILFFFFFFFFSIWQWNVELLVVGRTLRVQLALESAAVITTPSLGPLIGMTTLLARYETKIHGRCEMISSFHPEYILVFIYMICTVRWGRFMIHCWMLYYFSLHLTMFGNLKQSRC